MKPIFLILKPVEYKADCNEVIGYGTYRGYTFLIANYGANPCAYVRLPENHKFQGKDSDFIENCVDCHGGITYVGNLSKFGCEGVWIGWDYRHDSDYVYQGLNTAEDKHLHKWTTSEIVEEIEEVIRQL